MGGDLVKRLRETADACCEPDAIALLREAADTIDGFDEACAVAGDNGGERVLDWLRRGVDVFPPMDGEGPGDGDAIGKVYYCYDRGDRSVGISPQSWLELHPVAPSESPHA